MPSEFHAATRHMVRGDGFSALVGAARLEFEEHGYVGTNTNAIAKRAGYAPQTFYRHFLNKRAIFIAVYSLWIQEEERALALAQSPEDIGVALITHHKRYRVFRRSLRMLTVEDDEVGSARAKARLAQIAAIKSRSNAFSSLKLADQVATLLTIERMCDSAADGEFERLGVDEIETKALIVQMVSRFL
jgi:AcrR family transcriptional regulator